MNIPVELELLMHEYNVERKANFTPEEFLALATVFPAILIAEADNYVDPSEREYLMDLAKDLPHSFHEEQLNEEQAKKLTELYTSEFTYLLQKMHKWEGKFLLALKKYCTLDPNLSSVINELMVCMAEIHEGVSEAEKQKMTEIKAALGLGMN